MASRNELNVRRVGPSLIASFGKANPPLVWRFDLDRNHSFTLAMQGQDNEWELGVTSTRGDFHSIARFPVREDAEEALSAVSGMLSRGRYAMVWKFLRTLSLVVALFVAGFVVMQLLRNYTASPASVADVAVPPPPVADMAPPAPQPETPPSPVGVTVPVQEQESAPPVPAPQATLPAPAIEAPAPAPQPAPPAAKAAPPAPAALKTPVNGVPLPADDVLKPPSPPNN